MGLKRLLIDTNIYSLAMKGEPDIIEILRKTSLIGISVICIGELVSGFKGGKYEKKNRDELDLFLDSPRVRVYPVDEGTVEFYAFILDELRKTGNPIPTNDIWIAATAFQQGLTLFSKDRHFEKIPGLPLVV